MPSNQCTDVAFLAPASFKLPEYVLPAVSLVFTRQDRIFFPQTGDTPGQLAQKARARQQVIEGFKIGAGPGARQVDRLRQDDPAAAGQGGGDGTATIGGFKDELPAEPMTTLKPEDIPTKPAIASQVRRHGKTKFGPASSSIALRTARTGR